MKKITTIALLALFVFNYGLSAQTQSDNSTSTDPEVITLKAAMDYAVERNLELQTARNNVLLSEADKRQAVLNFLPSVAASIDYSLFSGTTFDQNAGRQFTQTTRQSRPNVGANFNIFNGLSAQLNKKSTASSNSSAVLNVDAQALRVKGDVMGRYLSVVLDKENLRIAEQNTAFLQKQLDREQKRVDAGVGRLNEVYNLQSNLADQQLTVLQLNNSLERNLLVLAQLMQLKGMNNIDVSPLEQELDPDLYQVPTFGVVLNEAIAFSPAVKASDFDIETSNINAKMARFGRLPTLTGSVSLGSNYSSNGALNPETGMFSPDASFIEQLGFNVFQFAQVSLNIPIFSRGVNTRNIQRARINVNNANIQKEQVKLQLTNNIQQLWLDLVQAKNEYTQTNNSLDALQKSFEFAKISFESGSTNSFQYLQSLNNLTRAQGNVANAKVQFIVRSMILDLYRGK